MLKITAVGNVASDVRLRIKETEGVPYAIIRLASERRYRDPSGNKLVDFVSIKVRGDLAMLCAERLHKGDRIAASGDFETIPSWDKNGIPQRDGFLIKAFEVEFLSPKRKPEAPPASEPEPATEASTEPIIQAEEPAA